MLSRKLFCGPGGEPLEPFRIFAWRVFRPAKGMIAVKAEKDDPNALAPPEEKIFLESTILSFFVFACPRSAVTVSFEPRASSPEDWIVTLNMTGETSPKLSVMR